MHSRREDAKERTGGWEKELTFRLKMLLTSTILKQVTRTILAIHSQPHYKKNGSFHPNSWQATQKQAVLERDKGTHFCQVFTRCQSLG